MTDETTPSVPPRGRCALLSSLALGLAAGGLFFLIADHFLSPPDCAFYWAWAETLARQGNFAFSDVYERLRMPTLYVWLTPSGRLSNDWPMGAGLLLLPVVMTGRAVAHAWMALWVVAALALWWRAAGALFTRGARLTGTAAALAGTPLLFYAAFGPFFSHPASFAAVTAFLVAWDRTRFTPGGRGGREWLLLGLLLGFAALVRPQNGLLGVVLLAELPRWRRGAETCLRPRAAHLALFVAGTLLAFSPQMLAWWTLYGSPFSLPKLDEMQWLRPHLAELLLSDFHGVFPWTPVYGLAALGLLVLARRDGVLAGGLALALAVQIYLNAANMVWWSGGSFGNRRLGDSAIIIAYALAALWDTRRMTARARAGAPAGSGTEDGTGAAPADSAPPRLLHFGVGLGAGLCVLWTLTLLLAERRGLLPLDRYVPLNHPEMRQRLIQTWSDMGETAKALGRPLAEALRRPGSDDPDGWLLRLAGALLLTAGTVLVLAAIRRLSLRDAGRLALPLAGLAALLAAVTGVAALRTPAERNPAVLEIVRRSPGILWDNYIELAYYEIMKERPREAEKAARKAQQIRPNHYSNFWYLATALRDQGRYQEAVEAYDQVLKLHPSHPSAARERDAARARLVPY